MSDDQRQFLALLTQPPARLTAEQVAWVLNFPEHSLARLVACGLLKPLGKPAPNGVKYFATVEVLALGRDRDWLHKASSVIREYWAEKNARRLR